MAVTNAVAIGELAERPALAAPPRFGRVLAIAAATLLVGGVVGTALFVLAHHVDIGNSDGATVVLEGKALAAGHLLLGGWSLSLDSFWSVDVPFYAAAVGLDRVSGTLLDLVPAVIAALVVLVCAALAADGRRNLAGVLGASSTLFVLTLPSRVMAMFFIQGPLHVATLLWCLLAFIALDRERFGWRWLAAVVLLALGLLGDLQTLLLGVAPVLAAALVLGHFARDLRAVKVLGSAPFAAGVLAVAIREVAKAVGTFAVPRANTFASGHQLLRNVYHLPAFLLELLGVKRGPFGPTELPLALSLLHLLVVAFVLAGPVVVALHLLQLLRGRGRGPLALAASLRLDVLLLAGFAASLATFVILPITNSDAYARYLVPAVVTGAALSGRVLGRAFANAAARERRALGGMAVALAAVLGSSYALELGGGAAPNPGGDLGAFLAAHGLHEGVGDYWDASVVTVESGGAVTVRPVIALQRRLVRYDKQSAASWYGPNARFDFFVFNSGAIWNGVDGGRAVRTFGQPTRVLAHGTYRIYVWARPFMISEDGSTGP